MSSQQKTAVGSIVWQDLTVPNAEEVSLFYQGVVGWKPSPHPMGEYHDYNMLQPVDLSNSPVDAQSGVGSLSATSLSTEGEGDSQTDTIVAGICHSRGINEGIPPQWILYVQIENMEASLERCQSLGGSIVHGPRPMGSGSFCVVQDPAGAVIGLISNS